MAFSEQTRSSIETGLIVAAALPYALVRGLIVDPQIFRNMERRAASAPAIAPLPAERPPDNVSVLPQAAEIGSVALEHEHLAAA
jgi:hypothetical protein